jgi:CRP-like cAMP-binding protein
MKELNIVEKVIALEGVDLFKGLTPDQLASIAAVATQQHVLPGTVLLDPKTPLEAMFVVLDGSVELSQDGVRLMVAKQNDVLGSWALLDEAPMPVIAKSIEDTVLLRISREDFFELLADNMEIALTIFSTLVRRFRALIERPAAS